MAKTKNKNKRRAQTLPYIDRIRRRQNFQKALENADLEREIEMRVQRAIWMSCIAFHRAFGIGTKRFYQKFLPEFEKVRHYWEACAEADLEYADTKLTELAREIAPEENVLIGVAVDIFNDRKETESEKEKISQVL